MKTVQELILSRRGQFQGIAIACDGRTMSYAEFDELTDRVAAGLQREGIGPGSFVAIRMPRSERMVAAIFGVIKAGAAIVPISGDMPEERFRSISSACTLAAVIDEEKLPAGEYQIRFVVRDVFNTTYYTDFVPVTWDGEILSY